MRVLSRGPETAAVESAPARAAESAGDFAARESRPALASSESAPAFKESAPTFKESAPAVNGAVPSLASGSGFGASEALVSRAAAFGCRLAFCAAR